MMAAACAEGNAGPPETDNAVGQLIPVNRQLNLLAQLKYFGLGKQTTVPRLMLLHWLTDEAGWAVAAQRLNQTCEQTIGIGIPTLVAVPEVRETCLAEANVIVHR